MKHYIKYLLVAVWMFSISLLHAHDPKMAHYTVHVSDNQMYCDIRMAKEDFAVSMDTAGIDGERSAASMNPPTATVLQEHLSFTFNGDLVPFSTVYMKQTAHWVHIRLLLQSPVLNPESVEIFNNLLLANESEHDNIMRFLFHDRTRVFRLNKNRQHVRFTY